MITSIICQTLSSRRLYTFSPLIKTLKQKLFKRFLISNFHIHTIDFWRLISPRSLVFPLSMFHHEVCTPHPSLWLPPSSYLAILSCTVIVLWGSGRRTSLLISEPSLQPRGYQLATARRDKCLVWWKLRRRWHPWMLQTRYQARWLSQQHDFSNLTTFYHESIHVCACVLHCC